MRKSIDFLNTCLWITLFSLTLIFCATNAFSSTIRYEYDLSGQLVVASYGGSGRAAFTYDDAGNMASQTVVGAVDVSSSIMLLFVSPPEQDGSGSILSQ
ncbi:MAG: hypothetical protein AAGU21_15570 [Solidesulfovibrio sp.]|uniref:hypothetical protein n=1 Tax=Solidesulfovibrio sp. TaxID=2910990 RepID=UPI00315861D9